MITRRTLLHGAAATAGLAASCFGTVLVAEQRIGTGRLSTVSDGHLVLPESFVLGNLPEEEARTIIGAAGLTPEGLQTPCNLALWQADDVRVLFDAGSGSGFMPSAGRLTGSLAALGLAPDDITHVVFTHGHPDHLWGVLDDFDEPLFANARHVMADREAAYWSDPGTLESLDPARQSFAAGASRRIEALGDRLERLGAAEQVLPGVTFVPLHGHTPGHVGARITHDGATALIVGDAIGNGHLALARPDWPNPADHMPELGIATRLELLAVLAKSGETMVGFHLPRGGMGRISAAETGYAFVPA